MSQAGELFIFVSEDETDDEGEILDKHGRPSQMGAISDHGRVGEGRRVSSRRVHNPNEAPLSGSGQIEIDDSREAPRRGASGRRPPAHSADDLLVDSTVDLDDDFDGDDIFGEPPPSSRRETRPRGSSESLGDLGELDEFEDLFSDGDLGSAPSQERSPFSDSGELEDLDDF